MFPGNVSNKVIYRSYFPPDVDKYVAYEKILESSGFELLCTFCSRGLYIIVSRASEVGSPIKPAATAPTRHGP